MAYIHHSIHVNTTSGFGGGSYLMHEYPTASHQSNTTSTVHHPDLLSKLESTGKVPSREKFRRMICQTFLSCGCCPYNDRCVFLHDPLIKIDKIRMRPSRQNNCNNGNTNYNRTSNGGNGSFGNNNNNANGVKDKDSFYWPDMEKSDILQKQDTQGLPDSNQSYVIPQQFRLRANRHDRAIYSMWYHFIETCQRARVTDDSNDHHPDYENNAQSFYRRQQQPQQHDQGYASGYNWMKDDMKNFNGDEYHHCQNGFDVADADNHDSNYSLNKYIASTELSRRLPIFIHLSKAKPIPVQKKPLHTSAAVKSINNPSSSSSHKTNMMAVSSSSSSSIHTAAPSSKNNSNIWFQQSAAIRKDTAINSDVLHQEVSPKSVGDIECIVGYGNINNNNNINAFSFKESGDHRRHPNHPSPHSLPLRDEQYHHHHHHSSSFHSNQAKDIHDDSYDASRWYENHYLRPAIHSLSAPQRKQQQQEQSPLQLPASRQQQQHKSMLNNQTLDPQRLPPTHNNSNSGSDVQSLFSSSSFEQPHPHRVCRDNNDRINTASAFRPYNPRHPPTSQQQQPQQWNEFNSASSCLSDDSSALRYRQQAPPIDHSPMPSTRTNVQSSPYSMFRVSPEPSPLRPTTLVSNNNFTNGGVAAAVNCNHNYSHGGCYDNDRKKKDEHDENDYCFHPLIHDYNDHYNNNYNYNSCVSPFMSLSMSTTEFDTMISSNIAVNSDNSHDMNNIHDEVLYPPLSSSSSVSMSSKSNLLSALSSFQVSE